MRSLGLAALALMAGAGCGGAAGSSDQTGEADSTASAVAPGHYEGLDIVVAKGKISGHFFDSVGDPAHGGATCEFTIAGDLPGVGVKTTKILAVDGFDSVPGELSLRAGKGGKPGLVLRLDGSMNACDRAAPMLQDPAGTPFDLSGKMEGDVQGYRSVSAAKAFFYDAPGKHPRSAFVLRGDTLIVTGPEAKGFVPVSYVGAKRTTKGFVKTADLASAAAPKAAPAAIGAGKYINATLGATLLVHGPCSSQNFLSNATGNDVAFGALGPDKHTISAQEGDVCGSYALTSTSFDVVMVTWNRDPSAHLGAEIESGCKFIEGEYDLTVPGTLEACGK